MALRIKCKCGKSLKVSSAMADKKIACPECKRPFRIPAEKFKTAEAAAPAQKPKPVLPPPAAAAPVPVPVELDITPQNIDLDWSGEIEHSQSDILGDLPEWKPPEANALQACPSCGKAMPPEAKLCVSCGYDLRTGQSVAGAQAGAEDGPGLPTRPRTVKAEDEKAGGGFKGLVRKFIGKSDKS